MSEPTIAHQVREVEGCPVLIVRGELTLGNAVELSSALTKLLLDRGRVLIDVSELDPSWPPAVAVFPTALARAGGWPCARLVLVAPSAELAEQLHAAKVPQAVPVAVGLREAIALLHTQPSHLSRQSELPGTLQAPTLARALTCDCCHDWDVPELANDAAIVATELVSNAVQHAGTACTLRLSMTPSGLHIAVHDDRATPGLGRLLTDPELAGDSYGILLVKSIARHVGVTHELVGKTVWAVLTRPA